MVHRGDEPLPPTRFYLRKLGRPQLQFLETTPVLAPLYETTTYAINTSSPPPSRSTQATTQYTQPAQPTNRHDPHGVPIITNNQISRQPPERRHHDRPATARAAATAASSSIHEGATPALARFHSPKLVQFPGTSP